MSQRVDTTGIVFIVVAAIGFGLLGPLARWASDVGFTPTSFAVWRSISSVAALALVLLAGLRLGRLAVAPLRRIARVEWLQLAAMGLFVAGTTLSLFWAFERTTIALTLIVFYTFPVMVAIGAVPIYGDRLGARRLAAIGLACLGLLLLLLGPAATDAAAALDPMGVAFAFVAALCQVGYALVGGRGFASVPAFQSATILRTFSLLFYALVLVPLVVLVGEGAALTAPLGSTAAWLLILVAGLLAAALPTALLVAGYRRIGPTRGAVLMLVEPVTGVLLAALLLSEQPTPLQLLGGALVLLGAALVQLVPGVRTGRSDRTAVGGSAPESGAPPL